MPANGTTASNYNWVAVVPPEPKSGYHYQALANNLEGLPIAAVAYASDTSANNGVVDPYNHRSSFGFIAMPSVYGREGVNIFIVNEEGVVYGVDNGESAANSPLGEFSLLGGIGVTDTWPAADPTTDNTSAGGRFWMVSD